MELEISIRDFVSGREKHRLTDFWHIRIEQEVFYFFKFFKIIFLLPSFLKVHAWLSKFNYVHDALPADYIEEKPEDLEVVRNNLKLIQEIIHKDDIHGVCSFFLFVLF